MKTKQLKISKRYVVLMVPRYQELLVEECGDTPGLVAGLLEKQHPDMMAAAIGTHEPTRKIIGRCGNVNCQRFIFEGDKGVRPKPNGIECGECRV